MTGHKLVRFSEKERQGLVRYVDNGGLLFSDDCNHDVNGLYAKSFEAGDARDLSRPRSACEDADRLIRCTARSSSSTARRRPSHELNGWGDNVVHGYLRGVERHGRLGVVYANQDYGCEWDYDWQNKRFARRTTRSLR